MPVHAPAHPPQLSAATIAEVLAIADALERAAATQYTMFGKCMRRVGHDDLAEIFEALAVEEQHHVDSVQRLAERTGESPATLDMTRWRLPTTFSAEEIGPPALLTPYKALSIAVRAEEKAFAFWAYVASEAASEAVRLQAEAMARQELVHAAKLRHARRKAYRDGKFRFGRTVAAAETELDLAAMRLQAAQLISAALDFLSAAVMGLKALSDAESADLLRQIADEIRTNADPRPSTDDRGADRNSILRRIEQSAVAGRAGILFDAAGVLERVMERYLQILENSTSSEVTEAFQLLGDQAARHVAQVNARLYAIEPSLAGIVADTPATSAAAPA